MISRHLFRKHPIKQFVSIVGSSQVTISHNKNDDLYQIGTNISHIFSFNSSIYSFATQKDRQSPNIDNKQQPKKQQKQKQPHTFDENSSYFDILGISPNASQQEIKTAYLEMVKRYHPDLSKQENASGKFQLVQKAYEILSDPEKRGKHKSQLNIPNPETYQASAQLKEKFKNFSRKASVPDELQFSYNLFKKHYEEVDAKEKEYKRFVGQGDQYWVHKDEMLPKKKVYVQQFAMIAGSVGIAAAALYYIHN